MARSPGSGAVPQDGCLSLRRMDRLTNTTARAAGWNSRHRLECESVERPERVSGLTTPRRACWQVAHRQGAARHGKPESRRFYCLCTPQKPRPQVIVGEHHFDLFRRETVEERVAKQHAATAT